MTAAGSWQQPGAGSSWQLAAAGCWRLHRCLAEWHNVQTFKTPQARPNAKALFVPAEITTYCYYPGAHKDYMVANAIFRMGGAAALLSNQARYYSSAKYELLHNARAHTGQDDGSYG